MDLGSTSPVTRSDVVKSFRFRFRYCFHRGFNCGVSERQEYGKRKPYYYHCYTESEGTHSVVGVVVGLAFTIFRRPETPQLKPRWKQEWKRNLNDLKTPDLVAGSVKPGAIHNENKSNTVGRDV